MADGWRARRLRNFEHIPPDLRDKDLSFWDTYVLVRRSDMREKRLAGWTLRALGDRWDISTERARQIVSEDG